jgi:hypothetical protein
MASTTAATACEALDTVKALCEGVDQWIEPYMLDTLPSIMDNLAAPKTHDSAMAAGNAILHKSNGHSIRVITNLLYESFTSMKWQTKKGSLVLLGALGTHHPIVVQRNLPEMILRLIGISSDVKKEVKEQVRSLFLTCSHTFYISHSLFFSLYFFLLSLTHSLSPSLSLQTRIAFTEICACITNVDIIPIIPRMIAGYMDPVKLTNDALDALVRLVLGFELGQVLSL